MENRKNQNASDTDDQEQKSAPGAKDERLTMNENTNDADHSDQESKLTPAEREELLKMRENAEEKSNAYEFRLWNHYAADLRLQSIKEETDATYTNLLPDIIDKLKEINERYVNPNMGPQDRESIQFFQNHLKIIERDQSSPAESKVTDVLGMVAAILDNNDNFNSQKFKQDLTEFLYAQQELTGKTFIYFPHVRSNKR